MPPGQVSIASACPFKKSNRRWAAGVKPPEALKHTAKRRWAQGSSKGTIIHLAGEMFVDALDTQVQHVPYKGMGPMLTDIISGQVERPF